MYMYKTLFSNIIPVKTECLLSKISHENVTGKIAMAVQWSILVISSILNYTSGLNAYPTNETLQACETACKHSLQAVVSIILGFSGGVSRILLYVAQF